jgi:hypothetical protein
MFQDEAPLLRTHAHPPFADTWTAAVNLVVVESDGSRPDRPDYLRGGGQARRHRAACNRGHGLLRGCVEFRNDRDASRTSNPAIIAGISTANKPGADTCNLTFETGVGGSATGSGPRVGEWLCNDLCLVLVHDITDVRSWTTVIAWPCDSSTRLRTCMRDIHSLAVSRNQAMPLVLRR